MSSDPNCFSFELCHVGPVASHFASRRLLLDGFVVTRKLLVIGGTQSESQPIVIRVRLDSQEVTVSTI